MSHGVNTAIEQDLLQPAGGWACAARVRIAPPPPRRQGLVFRGVSRLIGLFGRSQVPDIFTVLSLHPGLFWPWLLFASRLMPFGTLSGPDREMLILRTGWNCGSRYEWGQHVELGLKAGLNDADIVRVTQGPAGWDDARRRALMQACDDLCRDNVIGDAAWKSLAAHYRDAQCIEISMLVGHYRMIAGFLNSTGLVLEPPLEQALQDFHRRVAAARTGG